MSTTRNRPWNRNNPQADRRRIREEFTGDEHADHLTVQSINNQTEAPSSNIHDQRDQEYQYALNQQRLVQQYSEHGDRKKYTKKIFCLVRYWLLFIVLLIVVSGTNTCHGWFHISDKVLMTIITSTSIAVIGLFVIILRYLFSK